MGLLGAAVSLGLVLSLCGCRRPGEDRYVDVARRAGLSFSHTTGASGARHLPETVTGGAAWLDYDQDGDLDLYCVSGNEHPDSGGPGTASSRLYRNDGRGRFSDATEAAGVASRGYGMGVAVGDYQNDGLPDLYVTSFAPAGKGGNVLFRNEGNGQFRDVTREAGVAPGGWSTGAAFLDCDGDGRLDLYVARYVRYDPSRRGRGKPIYSSPTDFPGEPDVLYRQKEDGRFEDVSASAGIAFEDPAGGAGLGVLSLDFDLDGDADIFVANDQGPNYLFKNDGRGRFTDVALEAGVAYGPEGNARAGMGVDSGDLDLDGREDIVVTNFADEPDALFLAEGGGLYRDAAAALGVAGPTLLPLGFGVVLTDQDLDGDLDIYIAEGHIHDNIAELRPGSGQRFAQPDLFLENRLLENRSPGNQARPGFTDISRQAGSWFHEARVGRAAALADYDEDGDEDLVVVNAGGPAALLENQALNRGRRPGWLALKLRGSRANRDGYGARVAVLLTGEDGVERARFFEVRSARSYFSASDPRVRVGLGPRAPRSIRAIVRWPGPAHTVAEYGGIAPGRVTELVEPSEPPSPAVKFPEPTPRGPAGLPAPPATELAAQPAAGENGPELEKALKLASDLRAGHRIAEALHVLERAEGKDPGAASNPQARLLKAELLFSLYRTAEAASILEPLSREPGREGERGRVLLARALCELGRYREALEVFEALEREGVPLDGEARRARGRSLMESGRERDALEEISGLLAADPWLDAAYLDLGRALGRLGLGGRAAPFLARYRAGERARRREQAILEREMKGRAAEAEFERGEMELLKGRAFRALSSFNRALALDPSHGPAFLSLARLSARLAREEDALERLRRLPGDPAVAAVRSEIEGALRGEGELARARQSIRKRMSRKPLGACAGELAELAGALRLGGEPSQAREVALFAAELDPRSPEAQRRAAEIFEEPGEAFIRLWALERAARLEPGDSALRARRDSLARGLFGRQDER